MGSPCFVFKHIFTKVVNKGPITYPHTARERNNGSVFVYILKSYYCLCRHFGTVYISGSRQSKLCCKYCTSYIIQVFSGLIMRLKLVLHSKDFLFIYSFMHLVIFDDLQDEACEILTLSSNLFEDILIKQIKTRNKNITNDFRTSLTEQMYSIAANVTTNQFAFQ